MTDHSIQLDKSVRFPDDPKNSFTEHTATLTGLECAEYVRVRATGSTRIKALRALADELNRLGSDAKDVARKLTTRLAGKTEVQAEFLIEEEL